MRRNIHPVEELFEIRAEIRALKAREAELRSFFLERAGPAECKGPFHEVTITDQRQRVLDRTRLPREILADPRYWSEQNTPVLKLRRRADPTEPGFFAPDLPGWCAGAGDDLFEPFY